MCTHHRQPRPAGRLITTRASMADSISQLAQHRAQAPQLLGPEELQQLLGSSPQPLHAHVSSLLYQLADAAVAAAPAAMDTNEVSWPPLPMAVHGGAHSDSPLAC